MNGTNDINNYACQWCGHTLAQVEDHWECPYCDRLYETHELKAFRLRSQAIRSMLLRHGFHPLVVPQVGRSRTHWVLSANVSDGPDGTTRTSIPGLDDASLRETMGDWNREIARDIRIGFWPWSTGR